jgi:hypothetical protein
VCKVSVVQQNAPGDVDCADKMCALLKDQAACARRREQVRTFNVPASEAKGPVFARALGSRMVPNDAEFCMQIDSHMDFAAGWENHLLGFWGAAANEYGVLSTYVADLHQLGKCVNGQFEVPHLCQVKARRTRESRRGTCAYAHTIACSTRANPEALGQRRCPPSLG